MMLQKDETMIRVAKLSWEKTEDIHEYSADF